jgi:hypothetical protein
MVTLREQSVYESILLRIRFLESRSVRRWGKMTAPEMVCHLTDSFRGVLGEKQVSPATGLLGSAPGRMIFKWGALYAPLPWPPNVRSRPEVEQGKGGTPPGDFEVDRKALIAAIDRFRAAEQILQNVSHPIFGRMTFEEWQRWGYLHADHHLRQFGS